MEEERKKGVKKKGKLHRVNPSPPGQLQEQTPVEDPHGELEIKPQLKPRSSVTKE